MLFLFGVSAHNLSVKTFLKITTIIKGQKVVYRSYLVGSPKKGEPEAAASP